MSSDESRISFLDLPFELQQQIFGHIYTPWHFRFTHEHDSTADTDEPVLERTLAHLRESLPGTSIYSPLPSLRPLLVCRRFHNSLKPLLLASFVGHVHIASRLIWKEVHVKYTAIFARVHDLTILRPHVSSFQKLAYKRLFPRLCRIWIWCEVGWWGWDRPPALPPKSLAEDAHATITEIEAEVFAVPSLWDGWFDRWVQEAMWATSLGANFVECAEESEAGGNAVDLVVVKPFMWGRDMNLTARSNFRASHWMGLEEPRPPFAPDMLWARSVVVDYRYVGREGNRNGNYRVVRKRTMLDAKLMASGHHSGEAEELLDWNV